MQMLLLYVADIIILALGAALILVLFFLACNALAIIVRLPLAIITLIVFDINAESFVKQRVIEQSEGK